MTRKYLSYMFKETIIIILPICYQNKCGNGSEMGGYTEEKRTFHISSILRFARHPPIQGAKTGLTCGSWGNRSQVNPGNFSTTLTIWSPKAVNYTARHITTLATGISFKPPFSCIPENTLSTYIQMKSSSRGWSTLNGTGKKQKEKKLWWICRNCFF